MLRLIVRHECFGKHLRRYLHFVDNNDDWVGPSCWRRYGVTLKETIDFIPSAGDEVLDVAYRSWLKKLEGLEEDVPLINYVKHGLND